MPRPSARVLARYHQDGRDFDGDGNETRAAGCNLQPDTQEPVKRQAWTPPEGGRMTWTAETSLGNEAGKIRWELVEYTNGVGLDLGCGHVQGLPAFHRGG
jgi:hypothetical protein